jgi:hypothetical protein
VAYYSIRPGQKPAITSFTPDIGTNTNATRTGNYYKNADGQMVANYRIVWTGAPGGAGATFKFVLPTGYTFDQTRYLGTFDGVQATATKLPTTGDLSDVATNTLPVVAYAHSSTQFCLEIPYGPVLLDNRGTLLSGDSLEITVTIWVTGPGF